MKQFLSTICHMKLIKGGVLSKIYKLTHRKGEIYTSMLSKEPFMYDKLKPRRQYLNIILLSYFCVINCVIVSFCSPSENYSIFFLKIALAW